MTQWFTSDQHLGNANIIGYCDRPFNSPGHMDEIIIAKWNEVVTNNDVVYIVGDFAMGRIAETLPLAERLHGDKYLIPGNHDRVWSGNEYTEAKRREWVNRYEDHGITVMINQTKVWIEDNGWTDVCHFPYAGDSHGDDRYVGHRPVNNGEWLLCGHVHDAWKIQGKQINVGVDVWDFYPVRESTIADIINKGNETP